MTAEVPVLAAGFASKFESIGPYVGFGSLIAVAAMAVLVFAQGREIQRLREWTGRSPERLDELERTIAEQGVGAPQQAGRQLQPHPGAARPPARTAAGQTAAPGAAAAAAAAAAAPAGAPPRPPGAPGATPGGPPRPAVAANAAGQATAVTGASTATGTGTATPPPSNRPVPPRPTPPGGTPNGPRPGGPRPATPLGAVGATARERGEGGPGRSVPQLVGVGVLLLVILIGVLFAAGVFGGGGSPDTKTTPQANERTVPGQNEPAYKPANISVAVLNASGIPRVAAAVTDRVDNNRFKTVSVNGSRQGGNLTRNGSAVTQTASVVGYRGGRSNRAAATAIARDLRLPATAVQPMSPDIKEAAGTGNPDIVVVLGSTWVTSAAGKRIVPDQGTDAAGSGSTGSTGSTSSGSSGATGTGATGSTGTGGTSSGTGATGTSGTSGTSGATGTSGTAGTTDGTAGTADGTAATGTGGTSGGAGVTP